jgi:FkbM family methyltransferase
VDNANYDPPMLLHVAAGDALAEDPFVLVDVGCGLGIDPAWRRFGAHLHVHGLDPQLEEVERLRQVEESPNVQYHTAFVGLPDEPPPPVDDPYFDPVARSSTSEAVARATADGPAPLEETNDWAGRDLTTRKVGLADFLRSQGVEDVDFVKIDTDGGDLEVLRSFETMIASSGVLGMMVETPFTGSPTDSVLTFANVDRFLKQHGFLLCTLSVNRYSRAALPGPFKYSILAQTTFGQAMWSDVVYLREGAHPGAARYGELSPAKLLKLACLYELFQAPDVAAEILLVHKKRLKKLVDVSALLDLLTPPLRGAQLSYRDYVKAFEQDPTQFYPEPEPEPEAEPEPEPEPPPTTVARARRLAARALGR